MNNKMLVLENGKVFYGKGFGADCTKIAELVFNTSMVGYQEIISDPSYYGQAIVMSYPLIGNYGLADDDYESKGIYLSGMIVREYNDQPSNFRYTKTLSEALLDAGVPGIEGVDTREIVRIIRDEGVIKAMITDADRDKEECINEIHNFASQERLIEFVSTKKTWYARTRNPKYTVVAIDCGIKFDFIRKFNQCGCNVAVVPFDISKEEISKLKPDGIFVSNGPGDPSKLSEIIELIDFFKGKLPILGISLGHQLIAVSYGAKTYKMKFGHRGGNIPVKNIISGKVEITTQNHGYAVDAKTIDNKNFIITHLNLLDNEAEGFMDIKNKIITLQTYPEWEEGLSDSDNVFKTFIDFMEKAGGKKYAQENRY